MDHIDLISAITDLINENADLKRRLAEQTDKHWEGNRQIALYSDELRKLKEKAKPIRPEYEADGYDDKGELNYDTAYCPRCRRMFEVGYEDGKPFCDNCGQALDWGDADD